MQEDVSVTKEPITIIQESLIDLKAEKKFCSKLGFNFFIFAFIVMASQIVVGAVIVNFFPHILGNFSLFLIINMAPLYLIGFPILIMLSRKQEKVRVEQQKLSFGQFIGYLAVCYGVMLVGNGIGLLITYLIGILKGSPVQNSIMNVMSAGDIWGNILIVGLCAPIFEEIIFRKLFMDRMLRYKESIAVILSGFMFGLFHGNFNQFFYAFFIGMILAYIYAKTGKVRYCIVLHMIINMGSTLLLPVLQKIEALDIEQAMNILIQTGDMEQYVAMVMPYAIPLVLIFLYVVFTYGMGIVGIILLIIKRKKISFSQGKIELPKGKKFSTVIVNFGMIIYIIIWMAMFVSSIMA